MTPEELQQIEMANFVQKQRAFELQMQMEKMNEIKTMNIINAVDSALTENITLKKQIMLNNISNQKNQVTNSARTQPMTNEMLASRRTGKRKGGSVKMTKGGSVYNRKK